MQRWRVHGLFEGTTFPRGLSTCERTEYVDAETRDEAQHIGRERMVAADVRFKGAAYDVEPVEGKGWI